MPVEYRSGNLFEYQGSLAHGVNGVGAMGKGIAIKFKSDFPLMYKEYAAICQAGKLHLGNVYCWRVTKHSGELERYVYNLCIKSHWSQPAEEDAIKRSLSNMVKHMEKNSITEVALPRIGAGLGQLDWESCIKPIIEKISNETEVRLIVYSL